MVTESVQQQSCVLPEIIRQNVRQVKVEEGLQKCCEHQLFLVTHSEKLPQ